jgi:hypothetical protein
MAIALAASLAGTPQVSMEQPSALFVSPDVAVDGLVANGELTHPAEVPGHLLGTPLAAEKFVNLKKVLDSEAQVAPRTRASSISALLCFAGAVMAVESRAIAMDFARDGTAMAAQCHPNLRLVEPLLSQCGKDISFSGGDLCIRHDESPLPGSRESSSVLRFTSL